MSSAVDPVSPAMPPPMAVPNSPEHKAGTDGLSTAGGSMSTAAAAEPLMTAAQRLEASRVRLREAIMPPPPVPRRIVGHTTGNWFDHLVQRVQAMPAVEALIDTVRSWWKQHPMRAVAHVAGDASNAMVKPLAQTNPYSLVLAAALVGVVLSWTRPWRWLFRSAIFAGLLPAVASRLVASMPVESWVTMVSSAMSARRKASPMTHAQRDSSSVVIRRD